MDFALSMEQAVLKDSVRRFCDKEYPFSRRPQAMTAALDRRTWMKFAEQGWLGVLLPENFGGSDGTVIESGCILEEFGRALVLEPFLSCAVLAAVAIERGGSERHKQELLRALVSGDLQIALAHNEAHAQGRADYVTTRVSRLPSGRYSLSGHKQLVLGGAEADKLIVSARNEGAAQGSIQCFVLDSRHSGVKRRSYQLLDGRRAADIWLDDAIVGEDALLGEADRALPAIEAALDIGIVGLCADAVGAMDAALWSTRDYIRNRRAYGAPLSSFQALQHRMADMFAELELSRSVLYAAMASVQDANADTRHRLISAAKVRIAEGGGFVCGNAIQLHGAMGMVEENRVGHYFKRLTVAATLFGTTSAHLERFTTQAAPAELL